MLAMLSRVYGEVAWRRRQWYRRRAEVRRRLRRPVISIGALTVGGSGKTPLTAHVAQLLVAMGERPAVLSRGYGRAERVDGVEVVRDAEQVVGSWRRAGDEPWMLAQSLPCSAVVVAEDRYLAGRLAETTLGATVHLLDDGFQHLSLDRGTDLLLVSSSELDDAAVLPAGRLRERLATARFADALVVVDTVDEQRRAIAERLGVSRSFGARRRVGPVTVRQPGAQAAELDTGSAVLAVAGIAAPKRFVQDLCAAGFKIADTLIYRDHHQFTSRDAQRIRAAAAAVGAQAIVTTAKDYVRLQPLQPLGVPLAVLALAIEVEPAAPFRMFLAERLAAERDSSV